MYGNPYNPYGFPVPFGGQFNSQFNGPGGPQGTQQALFGQPTMSQPTPAPAASQTGPDWIPVTDIKQVEQVQVTPGGKAWVMLQNEPVFALRVADQMGLVTTSYYRFEKIDPAAVSAPAASPEYITRAEFNQFVASLRAPIAEQTIPTDPPVDVPARKEAAKK